MDSVFWLTPLIFAIAALVYVSRSGLIRPQLGPGLSAFKKMDFLLTEAERSFYEVLQRAVGEELIVFPKVRLADLVWLPKGTAGRQALLNRVLSKHVDFVICARSSLTPSLQWNWMTRATPERAAASGMKGGTQRSTRR